MLGIGAVSNKDTHLVRAVKASKGTDARYDSLWSPEDSKRLDLYIIEDGCWWDEWEGATQVLASQGKLSITIDGFRGIVDDRITNTKACCRT